MYDRAEDLQDDQPTVARSRRYVAALAVILASATASADETHRPIVTTLGWTTVIDAFVEVDAVPYSQHSLDEIDPSGSGESLNEESFAIRHGFVRLEAARENFFAELELDGNTVKGPSARVQTSQVGWRWSANDDGAFVRARAGIMLIPFGALTPTNARDRFFVEQPTFLRALFPGDIDAGATVDGAYGLVHYSVSAMNGAPAGDARWSGRDPSSSYDFMGRLGTDISLPHRAQIAVGISGLSGSGLHPGTPPTKDSLQWVDENQDGIVQVTELVDVAGSPAIPSQPFSRNAIGLDATVHWCICSVGHGMLQFEGAIAKNLDRGVFYADPITRSRNVRELGFAVAIEQDLGPHALAGVRYDRYDADRDANALAGVTTVYTHEVFSTLSIMAAARFHTARLTGQYDFATNPFGRADSGAPVSQRDDKLTFRAQVEF